VSIEVINAFNETATDYEKWYEEPLGSYVLKAELMALTKLIPPRGLGIDVGAGTGIFAKHLVEPERCIVCLDPAVKMIEQAKEKGLDVIVGIIELAPLREKVFDFAYVVATLEFVKDVVNSLKSIKSILKEGKSLTLMIINRDSSWGKTYIEAGKKGDPIFKYAKFLTLREAIEYLEKAGFKVKEIVGTLDKPPTVVPKGEPKLYFSEELSQCGVLFIRASVH